jgi:5'-nucleotidase
MKRYVFGFIALGAIAGGCQNKNAAANRPALAPVMTDISPTPPAPVYVAPSQPVQPVVTQAPAADPTAVAAAAGGTYTVQKGDTLYKLARQHYGDGKQWNKIAAANPGLSPSSLRVGQKIVIP